MDDFPLDARGHIELYQLLKATGRCASGGLAKAEIAAGKVRVDGAVELRKRCKLREGRIVSYQGHRIRVSGADR